MKISTEKALSIAKSNLQSGYLDKSKQVLELILRRDPNNNKALALLGSYSELFGRPNDAIKIYSKLIGSHGANNSAIKKTVRIYLRTRDINSAILLLDKYNCSNLKSYAQLNLLVERVRKIIPLANNFSYKNWDLVIVPSKEAIKSKHKYQSLLRNYNENKLNAAYEECQTLIKEDPMSCTTRSLHVDISYRLGKYVESVEASQILLSIDNTSVLNLSLAARSEMALNNLVSAERYIKLIENFDLIPISLDLLGLLYYKQHNYVKSLKYFKKSIYLEPQSVKTLFYIGVTCFELSNYEAAERHFRILTEVSPNTHEAFYNLGNTLYIRGSLTEAVDAYSKAICLRPDIHEYHNNLGVALQQAGNVDDSRDSYLNALHINPKSIDALNNLGNLSQEGQKYEMAIQYYSNALCIDSKSSASLTGIGKTLLRQGKFKEALAHLRQVNGSILFSNTNTEPKVI